MKQLSTIIEDILDADFDIKDEDVLPLSGAGYVCTKCTGNSNFWEYAFSSMSVMRGHFNMDILTAARIAREHSENIDKIIANNPKFQMNDVLCLTAYLLSQAKADEDNFVQAFNDAIQFSAKKVRCAYKYRKTSKSITFSAEWPIIKAKFSATFKKQ